MLTLQNKTRNESVLIDISVCEPKLVVLIAIFNDKKTHTQKQVFHVVNFRCSLQRAKLREA